MNFIKRKCINSNIIRSVGPSTIINRAPSVILIIFSRAIFRNLESHRFHSLVRSRMKLLKINASKKHETIVLSVVNETAAASRQQNSPNTMSSDALFLTFRFANFHRRFEGNISWRILTRVSKVTFSFLSFVPRIRVVVVLFSRMLMKKIL